MGRLHGTDRVHKASIIPRGIGALGYTLQRPTEDRYLMTREEMEAKLAVLHGGGAAEYLIFGHYSTGASDDLARATHPDAFHLLVLAAALSTIVEVPAVFGLLAALTDRDPDAR